MQNDQKTGLLVSESLQTLKLICTESFHHTLKYVYMKEKDQQKSGQSTAKISHDKAFEHICRVEKGKVSDRLPQFESAIGKVENFYSSHWSQEQGW